MLCSCRAFNGTIPDWNVLNATDVTDMFSDCLAFNSDAISGIENLPKVEDADFMLDRCTAFLWRFASRCEWKTYSSMETGAMLNEYYETCSLRLQRTVC